MCALCSLHTVGKFAANSRAKKVTKKTQKPEKSVGLFDFLMSARNGGNGGLELLNPTVNKYRSPEEYDTRSLGKKMKRVEKSKTIDPKNPATW